MERSDPTADQRVVALLRCLANPHRYAVLQALARQPLRGKEVSTACSITPQEASRHLGRLATLGLVERGPGRAFRATEQGSRVLARLRELGAGAAPQRDGPTPLPGLGLPGLR